ncbi:hypothetical protein UFOVP505_56 [uncultured Caudovirales phage]|uniref:Bacteriophage lambda, Stf, side tail fibre-repeat-2 n=1 Tax=uncultured Caudovirales phage TaxID=2100421 RepID=A0A6J5MSK4_9CAUD|nr:hypothetical protein UFOVP505_56 [uncultured Caudovirales phage]
MGKGNVFEAPLRAVLAETMEQARLAERAATQEVPPTGSGTGTVTSVALTMPAIFSVTGSPVTAAGTLDAALANQSANRVFAGPIGGGAAAPTFRALVAADIPALSYGTGTVTSVALSLPAIFTVSGSPITGSGTLTGTLATQTANTIWAGPTTGAAAAPTFRAMVAADVPNSLITYAKIQNMTTARLLGRTTAGSGVVEEISVGSGLTLSGGVLDAVGGATITGSGTDTYLTRWTGASSIGNSTLYLSSGKIVSASSDSGLKVVRTGADASSDNSADAPNGYTATMSNLAVDRDGGGSIVHRAGFSSDSLTEKTRVYGHLTWQTDATYDIGASGANRPRDAYLSRSLYAASIKLLGSGSGTATITPPAVAGTPTLTLPTSTGTLALTSDIPAAGAVSTKTADYTTVAADGTILVSPSTAAITIDLLNPAAYSGKIVYYKHIGTLAYYVRLVARVGTVETAHAVNLAPNANYAAVGLQSDGTQWWIISAVGSYTLTPALGALWALNWHGQGSGFAGAGINRQRAFGRGKQYLFGQSFGGR